MNKETERINLIGSWIMKILSLGSLLMLAIIYDGSWTYILGGASLSYLGVELGKRIEIKDSK